MLELPCHDSFTSIFRTVYDVIFYVNAVMLKVRGMHVNDLDHDLKNGVLLVNLLEVLSRKQIPVYPFDF